MKIQGVGSYARLLALAAAMALIGFAALPAQAQVTHLDETVSDDGSVPPSSREAGRSFSPSFKGAPGELGALDAATIRAGGARLAAADFRERVRRAKPIRPLYAGPGPNPALESVIGADGRTRVTNTKTFPARATVMILFEVPGGGTALCSGWLVSRNTVVTAGHCVANGDGSPLFDKTTYEIAPGYNDTAADPTPYGVCGARKLYTNATWKNTADDQYDYAVIKLDCMVPAGVGFYGYSTSVARTNPITVQGYPGDKPFGTQWKMPGTVSVLQVRRVFYKLDTAGGQSGSPVWRNVNGMCTHCGVAVHAYGVYGSPPFSNNNHGTRIIQGVFNNITNWKNAP